MELTDKIKSLVKSYLPAKYFGGKYASAAPETIQEKVDKHPVGFMGFSESENFIIGAVARSPNLIEANLALAGLPSDRIRYYKIGHYIPLNTHSEEMVLLIPGTTLPNNEKVNDTLYALVTLPDNNSYSLLIPIGGTQMNPESIEKVIITDPNTPSFKIKK